jgi:pilus assembly protein CpaF
VLMTGLDLPLLVVRQQIASAVHVIVQVARFSDGTRKISHITEITGMEGNVITTQDIFKFEHEGLDEDHRVLGALRAQGIRPTFAPQFELAGIPIPPEIFGGAQRW